VAHRAPRFDGFVAWFVEFWPQQGGLGVAVMARALPAQPVDGPVAGRGGDPGARVGRQAGGRPPLEGHGEGVLDRLFGDVDVTEEADQGGGGPARLRPEDRRDVHGYSRRTATGPARPGTGGPRPGPCRPPWPGRPGP